MMTLTGIDTTKFKAHSARGVSTSKAFRSGVSVDDVITMADLTNAGTFFKFYCRLEDGTNKFSRAVLDLGQYTCNNNCSFEPVMLYLMMFSEI